MNREAYKALVADICKNSSNWHIAKDSFNKEDMLVHEDRDISVWIYGGFPFYSIWKPSKIKFTLWQKIYFIFILLRYRWIEKARIKNDIRELKRFRQRKIKWAEKYIKDQLNK